MKRKVTQMLVVMLLLIMVAIAGIGTIMIKKYAPSDKEMRADEYYGITSEDEVALILQDENSEEKGKIIDGQVYLDYQTVSSSLNKRFYWDKNEGKLLYTTPTDIITILPESTIYESSGQQQDVSYPIFKVQGDKGYLALSFVQQFTDIEYQKYESPNRIYIRYKWGEIPAVTAKKDTKVRYKGGIKSDILTEVEAGSEMLLVEEMENWSKVVAPDGYIGYLQKKDVTKPQNKTFASSTGFQAPEYTSQVREHKINLAWHQVTSQDANAALEETLADVKGINVLSPTWFSVTDNSGSISSLVSPEYVALAHERGLEVWGLVDNFNEQVSSLELLSRTQSRTALIQNLMQAVLDAGLDGINVDFEALTEEESPHFIQFIRELSIECRKNSLVLSIDNYVPTYTSHYDRKEQGVVADYVIIMGYDEHTNGSEEPGSVASLPFVRDGIERTLKEVPASKIINGVPFYTRLWKVSDSGDFSSEVMSMEQAAKFVGENQMETFWNTEVSQNYAEVYKDNTTYKIWLEDASSIGEKVKAIQEYDLAGIAAWKLGLEDAGIWDVMSAVQ